jgi:hypothetical protein
MDVSGEGESDAEARRVLEEAPAAAAEPDYPPVGNATLIAASDKDNSAAGGEQPRYGGREQL